MPRLLLVCLALLLAAVPAGAQRFLPVEEAFSAEVESATSEAVTLRWSVAEGYYLYRDKIDIAAASAAPIDLGDPVLPEGMIADDRYFGESEIYREGFTTRVPIVSDGAIPAQFDLTATYQGCAIDGICYPPHDETVTVAFAEAGTDGDGTSPDSDAPWQHRLAAVLGSASLAWMMAAFYGAGLLLTFSPCVLPMLPILSGVIAGDGAPGRGRGFLLSLAYVVPMALAYAALGTAAGLVGANLQASLQSPWVLVPFAGLFVILAAAMFGLFTLQLPETLQARVAQLSQRLPGGRFTAVAAMGVLSALIAGPCMTAPLAAALLYIGQTGDAVMGGIALLSLGLGMGTPLLIVGTLGAQVLPKAGPWMTQVQVVFGFVFLGLAIWMLERILPDVAMVLLAGLLVGAMGVALGALEPLPASSGPLRRLAKISGLALGLWGAAMVLGAAAGATDPLRPLEPLASGPVATEAQAANTAAEDDEGDYIVLQGREAVEAQLADARAAGEPVVIDFYADWCISCKVIEREVFGDPEVAAAMDGVRRLRPDVTANTDSDQALQDKFNVVGPPTLIFIDADGEEQRHQRIVGEIGADEYLDRLQQAFGDV